MTELTLTRGVPASGKTTWAMDAAEAFGHVRVNRDELRTELHLKHGQNEPLVTKIQHARVRELLENGVSVIVDDTNLTARFVKEWLKIGAEAGALVEFVDFPITYDEAVYRDYKRGVEGGSSVGEEVIKSFFDRYIVKGQLPKIPVLTDQDAQGQFPPYVADKTLPEAFGFDLDGTLARFEGLRGPYDEHLYAGDRVDGVLLQVNHALHNRGFDIIIFTGRSAEYRTVVEKWLKDNDVRWNKLVMRPQGDKRRDDIIKSELFDVEVAPHFNFLAQFDDRNRVVDALRSKGINVYQVAPGNF